MIFLFICHYRNDSTLPFACPLVKACLSGKMFSGLQKHNSNLEIYPIQNSQTHTSSPAVTFHAYNPAELHSQFAGAALSQGRAPLSWPCSNAEPSQALPWAVLQAQPGQGTPVPKDAS